LLFENQDVERPPRYHPGRMTIRTKVWLLVAGSVAIIAGATVWLHTYALRRALTDQAKDSARSVAGEIVDALAALDASAEDQDLYYVLSTFSVRHMARIQLLELHVEREDTGSALSIVARRGDQPEIRRLGPAYRLPEHRLPTGATGANTFEVQQVVDLQGPWKANLLMHWSLGSVEGALRESEWWAVRGGLVQILVLSLLLGLVVDRTVVKRLEVLGAAMRDVERGDLGRRVPDPSNDEVGRLSQGFNRMLDQLSAADKEIRAFNQRLAQEIQAATQDLSKKNVALDQLNRLLIDLRKENASRVRLATLGQLAAQLAHEIGTPLSSVSGHLQLGLMQGDLPLGLRDRLEVSVREIARIGRIVRDYLDSTRSLEPERKPASLRQILTEAAEVAGGMERERPHRPPLVLDLGDDPPGFHTDAGLLRQIVINLLTNGLDASPGAHPGRVTLQSQTTDVEVVISVSDHGTGIPPEDLRRIFEPFYTTKGRGKGTGLGLAICRELCAALGGSISVTSTSGQGSTFEVRLPLRGSPPGNEPRLPHPPSTSPSGPVPLPGEPA
jgi:two-component system, NtrC family, sensor kinase